MLLDVLSKTAVISAAFVGKLKKIETEDYSPQFPLRLMSKDMIVETARNVGADLTAGRAAKSVLDATLKANGHPDWSAIASFVAHRAGEQPNLRQVAEINRVCGS